MAARGVKAVALAATTALVITGCFGDTADAPDAAASVEPVATGSPAPGLDEAGSIEVPRCFGRRATILGSPGDDRIAGTRREDVIVTFGGDDHVYRLRDDDRVCTGDGEDRVTHFNNWQVSLDLGAGADRVSDGGQLTEVRAGLGDDHLTLNAGAVEVDLGPGDDVLRVDGRPRNPLNTPCVSYRRAGPLRIHLFSGVAVGQGRDRLVNVHCLYGGPFGDRIVGTAEDDFIDSGGGSNQVVGGNGNDVISHSGDDGGGLYGDLFQLGPGNDQATGGSGRDTVNGGPGNDSIQGLEGGDWLSGATGNDQVNGTFYCDIGSSAGDGMGDASRNRIKGGPGNDEVTGDRGNDIIDGGDGIDRGYPGPSRNPGADVVRSVEQVTHCP